jgi:Protein of unknown function (DUF1552)
MSHGRVNDRTLERRRFLKAAGGIALGLPFLELFAPRSAKAAAAATPKRLVTMVNFSGVNYYAGGDSGRPGGAYDTFFPKTAIGSALTAQSWAGQGTEALNRYFDKISIPRNMVMSPGGFWYGDTQPGNTEGGDHGAACIALLSCQKGIAVGGGAPNRAGGMSFDTLAASKINPGVKQPLVLCVQPRRSDSLGYVSYASAGTPSSQIVNPWNAYATMVSSTPDAVGAVDRNALRRRSVLDLVSSEVNALKRAPLSQSDKQKLDMHYSAIRDFENGSQQAGLIACRMTDTAALSRYNRSDTSLTDDAANYPEIGKLHMDVLTLALACDYNRVATLQWGSGTSEPTYNWISSQHTYGHHPYSHHSASDTGVGDLDTEASKTRMREIDTWHTAQFVYLLDSLSRYNDSNGTMLDNSAVLWLNEFSDGYAHGNIDMAAVVAGSAGGYLRTGRHFQSASTRTYQSWLTATPHNMLFTTLLNAVGVRADNGSPYAQFGIGSAGEMSELKA